MHGMSYKNAVSITKRFRTNLLPLEAGVPRGSKLGPLLFLLYINDLASSVSLECVKFVDDTNLLISNNDFTILIKTLNKELEKVSDLVKANQLKLNAQKTKMVHFSKKIHTNRDYQ